MGGDRLVLRRNRKAYACVCLGIAALGLTSRHYNTPVSTLFGKYPGDTLWAMLAYCGLAFVVPTARIRNIARATGAIALSVEVLKWVHAPWIVGLRASTVGGLVLGHVFSLENLAAYMVGIAICVIAEALWVRWYRRSSPCLLHPPTCFLSGFEPMPDAAEHCESQSDD